jgi:hypothetical protein
LNLEVSSIYRTDIEEFRNVFYSAFLSAVEVMKLGFASLKSFNVHGWFRRDVTFMNGVGG